jgi:uncharacterized protein
MSAARDLPWHVAPGGVLVDVRLTPRGGRDAIEGVARGANGRVVLKARVRAAPFEGAANAALCRLLADATGVAPRQATLVAGATAREKRVRISGDATCLAAALARLVNVDAKTDS